MARKGTLGYEIGLVRKKAQRRIKQLRAMASVENASDSIKQFAKSQITRFQSLIRDTYVKSKTDSATRRAKAAKRLEYETRFAGRNYRAEITSFAVTQQQLNLASVEKDSIYTKAEAAVFYRATQRIWQNSPESLENRNVAILSYYNQRRAENGLSPLSLNEIVDYILKENDMILKAQGLKNPTRMSEEERKLYEDALAADNDDNAKGSPPGIGQAVINSIRDALDELITLPNPLDIDTEV